MGTLRVRRNPGSLLEQGAAILALARAMDTKPIARRLSAFTSTHQRYAEAQRKVDAAEGQLQAQQARAAQCGAEQGRVAEAVACALVAEGRPWANPFTPFGLASPRAIRSMPVAEAAATLHKLVAALHNDKTVREPTLQAAQAAEQAAQAVDKALLPIGKLKLTVRNARRIRNAIGETWGKDLAALKRAALAASDDGGPDLYTALFGHLRRSKKKAAAATATPASTSEQLPAPAKTPAPTP